MRSYKWGYKSPNLGYNYSTLLITPLISTHEPPTRGLRLRPYILNHCNCTLNQTSGFGGGGVLGTLEHCGFLFLRLRKGLGLALMRFLRV